MIGANEDAVMFIYTQARECGILSALARGSYLPMKSM
jgi:hypothetical protein